MNVYEYISISNKLSMHENFEFEFIIISIYFHFILCLGIGQFTVSENVSIYGRPS